MKIIVSVIALILISNCCLGQSPDSVVEMQVSSKNFFKEKPAEFPGGQQAWLNYLSRSFKYPKDAVKKNIQGTVRVQFIIDTDGSVNEVEALNDPGGGLAAAAIKIIKGSPKWIPAEQLGKKVKFRHIQAIVYKID